MTATASPISPSPNYSDNAKTDPPAIGQPVGTALDLAPVVSEGVETAEQLASLQAMGCDLAQGFLLGRPASLVDLIGAPALSL